MIHIRTEVTADHLQLFDALGRSVLSETVNTTTFTLDVSQLKKGMYLLQISNRHGVHNQKVIKE